jgi:4-amino-4-deoxy-L-arabinose transferase-like glycosyltransferase
VSSLPTTAGSTAVPLRLPWARVLAHGLALPVVFGVALLYHGLASLGHRTPLIFDDELLYTKLAQSIATGHGLQVWGHHYFFPAPLAPLVQAPVWLLFGTGEGGYLAVRILGALLMASAAFPAYALARRLVRAEWAILAAVFAVSIPSMAYHDYLTAEALAYPLFLLACAAIVHAVADGTRIARILVPVSCALAVATRLQLVILPLAYGVAVVLCSPRRRAHIPPLAALALPAAAVFAIRGKGAIGQYNGVLHFGVTLHGVVHWSALVALLLPFSLGLAIVPGSLLGLFARPRNRAEAAFAVVALVTMLGMLAQAGYIAAGEAQRPMERYAFYAAPLLAVAFFLYVERGAQRRLLYSALALGGGLAVARMPFGELAPPGSLYFDAPTATSFASLAGRFGSPNATLAIELVALAVGIGVAVLAPRRPALAAITALGSIGLALGAGAAYYQADHSTTAWAKDRFAAPRLAFVDRPATYLSLPRHDLVPDATLEIWNPNVISVAQFSRQKGGALPLGAADLSPSGVLLVDGKPNRAGIYVVGNWGSRIGFGTEVLARNDWQTELRLPRGARAKWLASGLRHDGFSAPYLRFQVFRKAARPGRFVVTLSLPPSRKPKTVTAQVDGGGKHVVALNVGDRVRFSVAAPATPVATISLTTTATGTTSDSLVGRGVRVERIVFVRD